MKGENIDPNFTSNKSNKRKSIVFPSIQKLFDNDSLIEEKKKGKTPKKNGVLFVDSNFPMNHDTPTKEIINS